MRLEMSWWGSHEVVKELTEPTCLITFHGWQFFKYCGGVRLKKKVLLFAGDGRVRGVRHQRTAAIYRALQD